MAFITAKTGKNVKALVNLSQSLFKQAQKRVSTGTLNRILREAVEAHPPARARTARRASTTPPRSDVAPPTIVLFVNSTRLFDPTYQRYLLNVFREKLPFHDIPIKLYMRSEKQTEPGARVVPGTSGTMTEAHVDAALGRRRTCRPAGRNPPGRPFRRRHPLPQPRGQRAAFGSGRVRLPPDAARLHGIEPLRIADRLRLARPPMRPI